MRNDNPNGRVTIRDIMELQEKTLNEISSLKVEMAVLKTKVAWISATIATVATIIIEVIFINFMH